MVKIKTHEDASKASDSDPTTVVLTRFITHRHVASSHVSIGDPTDAT